MSRLLKVFVQVAYYIFSKLINIFGSNFQNVGEIPWVGCSSQMGAERFPLDSLCLGFAIYIFVQIDRYIYPNC